MIFRFNWIGRLLASRRKNEFIVAEFNVSKLEPRLGFMQVLEFHYLVAKIICHLMEISGVEN